MKVALGFVPINGPYGGGNRFVKFLGQYLTSKGHSVCYALKDADIDIILMMDPRRDHPLVTFTPGSVARYLLFKNRLAIVIHRINECDERKNTSTMNAALRSANRCADYTVFVGSWLRNLDVWARYNPDMSCTIKNGSDTSIFNSEGHRPWNGSERLKLVTHHWGGNWMKGFDIYSRLDLMLGTELWSKRLEFTYIGNLPPGFAFSNSRHVLPLDEYDLAAELKSHHAYVTASINEPGSNHQNEGALCGLPLLYRLSGCLEEYCSGFGIAFDDGNFEEKLEELFLRYNDFANKMGSFSNTSESTAEKYLCLFEGLIKNREQIVGRRVGCESFSSKLRRMLSF